MTEATTEIRALLEEIDETAYGSYERSLLDRAIALAEEAGEEELAYEARMRLTVSAQQTGDSDAMIASFAWCSGKHEQDPVRFPQDVEGRDLLFHAKWMASVLAYNPVFARDQIDAVHADMARRYRAAGVSLSGVHQSEFWTAMICGDLGAADRFREQRLATETDDYSHCEACVRAEDACFYQLQGRDEDALRLYAEIEEQGLRCGEEPESSEADSLLALLRAGRLADARSTHLRSYRVVRHSADAMRAISRHLVFCVVTGNTGRALTLLERHLRGLALDPPNQATRLELLQALALTLDAVTLEGQGASPVRGSDDPELVPWLGRHEGPWSVADLAATCWELADVLAAAFDERNGNGWWTGQVAATRELAGVRYDVPVEATVYVAPEAPAAAEPVDGAGWLALAREAASAGDGPRAAEHVRRGLAIADDADRVRLCSVGIQVALRAEDTATVDQLLATRQTVLRATGGTDQAELEADLGVLLFGAATEDDVPRLQEALERARVAEASGGAAEVVTDLLITLGVALRGAGRLEEAVEPMVEGVNRASLADVAGNLTGARLSLALLRLDLGEVPAAVVELDAVIEAVIATESQAGDGTGPDPVAAAPALYLRAQILASEGELEPALAMAERFTAIQVRVGNRSGVVAGSRLSAAVLTDLERDDAAAARLVFALAQAELGDEPDLSEVRFDLAAAQLRSGAADLALEGFDAVFREETDASPQRSAELLYWIGESASAAGEPDTAYAAWRRGLAVAAEDENLLGLHSMACSLGQFLMGYGDPEAVEVLTEGLEAARTTEELGRITRSQHLLGRARVMAGDEGGIADLDEVIAVARREHAPWLVVDVLDSKARALAGLQRAPEALAAAQEALSLAAEHDLGPMLGTQVLLARILVDVDRGPEAVGVYEMVLGELEADTPDHADLATELADLHTRLGDHAAAGGVRTGGLFRRRRGRD